MKLINNILKFFRKLFGKEHQYLLKEHSKAECEISKNIKSTDDAFLSSVRIEDEELVKNKLDILLNELNHKDLAQSITKEDLIRLQNQIDKNMNILLRKNNKQYEDIKRYQMNLEAYKKHMKNVE